MVPPLCPFPHPQDVHAVLIVVLHHCLEHGAGQDGPNKLAEVNAVGVQVSRWLAGVHASASHQEPAWQLIRTLVLLLHITAPSPAALSVAEQPLATLVAPCVGCVPPLFLLHRRSCALPPTARSEACFKFVTAWTRWV